MFSEFEFIEKIGRKFSLKRIGDDCAVLPKDAKTDLVITADLMIEEIDFRVKWTTPEFLGHKALAVSLSDVAAMGAKPVWAMLSIGIPAKIWKTDFVEKFYEGWFGLADKFAVELIGGDVSKTPKHVVIDSIVAGEVRKGKAVLRSGARVGDLIFVTGELGGAAAGLKLLEKGEKYKKSNYQNLLLRQLAPHPQTEIGRIIGEKNLATSMIDLSDGLSSDLRHLCRASQVGAQIFTDKIPLAGQLSFALNGGEDFELLFTASPKKYFQIEKELTNHKISLIGEITANAKIIELITDGKSQILEPKGFRHF